MREGVEYDKLFDEFEVTAVAIDKMGRHCIVKVAHDPIVSGANPYYWSTSFSTTFTTAEEARKIAQHASGSHDIKTVDDKSIQVVQYSVMMKKEVKLVGVVE